VGISLGIYFNTILIINNPGVVFLKKILNLSRGGTLIGLFERMREYGILRVSFIILLGHLPSNLSNFDGLG